MKRRLGNLAIATALILSLWIGSYITLRLTNSDTSLWSKLIINGVPVGTNVAIPEWMEPVKTVYRPLMAIDHQLTGQRVHLGNRRIHIGATADF